MSELRKGFEDDTSFFKSSELGEGGLLLKRKPVRPIGSVDTYRGKQYIRTAQGWRVYKKEKEYPGIEKKKKEPEESPAETGELTARKERVLGTSKKETVKQELKRIEKLFAPLAKKKEIKAY